MQIATGEIKSDYERTLEYIETMKGVYQRTIDKHQRSGNVKAADIASVREHLSSLETMERLLREHHEMATGREYRNGKTRPLHINMTSVACLIMPDGTRKEIHRG